MKAPNTSGTLDGRAGSAADHEARGAEAERERLRAALHDGIGQLLTSISFLASSLRQKLAERDLPEESEAGEILFLTTQAIREIQSLVHGEPLPNCIPGTAKSAVASNPLT
jgi:signal transduction histidine kinase